MDQDQQAIELLEATHRFPCAIMVKVIGVAGESFVSQVVEIVREVSTIDEDPPHRTRSSASGRHIAITLEPPIESAQQVLLMYERIREVEGVVMVM